MHSECALLWLGRPELMHNSGPLVMERHAVTCTWTTPDARCALLIVLDTTSTHTLYLSVVVVIGAEMRLHLHCGAVLLIAGLRAKAATSIRLRFQKLAQHRSLDRFACNTKFVLAEQ